MNFAGSRPGQSLQDDDSGLSRSHVRVHYKLRNRALHTADGEDFVLRVSTPKGIFGLQSHDRMNPARALNGLGSGFRKTR
jgi:hypothetical protein